MSKNIKKKILKDRTKADIKRVEILKAFFKFSQQQSFKKRLVFCYRILFKKFK